MAEHQEMALGHHAVAIQAALAKRKQVISVIPMIFQCFCNVFHQKMGEEWLASPAAWWIWCEDVAAVNLILQSHGK